MNRIIIASLFVAVLTCSQACSTFKSNKGHDFPSAYKSQLHGWLHDAEAVLGLPYKGKSIKVHIVDGTQVTRGRARTIIEGEMLPSHARLGRNIIYLVRYPNGQIKPEEAIHEFQHLIGDSHGWPRESEWHHRKFKELGSPY